MTTYESAPEAGLSSSTLKAALAAAEKRTAELTETIESLVAEREGVAREARLLHELLAVREGKRGVDAPDHAGVVEDLQSPRETPRRGGRPPHPAVAAALEELERAGRPLHISELMRLLKEREVEIPGSGQQANLIAHLTRTPEITRPSRGMYALSTWGLQPPLKKAKRRRVAGKSKSKAT